MNVDNLPKAKELSERLTDMQDRLNLAIQHKQSHLITQSKDIFPVIQFLDVPLSVTNKFYSELLDLVIDHYRTRKELILTQIKQL